MESGTSVILQTLGGILLTISMGLITWALKQLVKLKETVATKANKTEVEGVRYEYLSLSERVARNEASDKARREEYERRFVELREDQHRQYTELSRVLTRLGEKVENGIEKIDGKVTRVHTRIDQMVKGDKS